MKGSLVARAAPRSGGVINSPPVGETTAYGAHPLSASTIFGRQAADSAVEYLAK